MSENFKKLLESILTPSVPGSTANDRRRTHNGVDPKGHKIGVNEKDKGSVYRKKDALRKQRERSRIIKPSTKLEEDQEEIDPRDFLEGPFKLTLGETFIKDIIDYYQFGKSKFAIDAIDLCLEYQTLADWAKKLSLKQLPNNSFKIYCGRPALGHEQIGDTAHRSDNRPHNWYLSPQEIVSKLEYVYSQFYIMETTITPDKCIFYFPAFLSEIEKLILSGKIEEPQNNIIREIRKRKEIVVEEEIHEGRIIDIKD